MNVNGLTLRGFRNYGEAAVRFDAGINVISGQNAQGKTNLLEAVYLLAAGRSFRTRFDRELIGFDRDAAELDASVYAAGREQSVRILLRRGLPKQIWRNRVKTRAGEFQNEGVRAVLFCPDDLNLIRDGAAARRRLMDLAISQLRPGYAALLADYRRVYENKTRLLRDFNSRSDPHFADVFDAFSDTMARLSAKLIRYRASFARRLAKAAASIHREFIPAETLEIRYTTVGAVTDCAASEQAIYREVMAHQAAHRAAETAAGSCLTGAHKDDLEIGINGRPARTYASQGQTRTAALSLKLAEREIFLEETGEYPVLLLDDVLSELDAARQDYVLNRIGGGQTLITCCEDGKISGNVILIENGMIR